MTRNIWMNLNKSMIIKSSMLETTWKRKCAKYLCCYISNFIISQLRFIYRYERMSYLTSYRETVPRHVALGSPGCVGDWTRWLPEDPAKLSHSVILWSHSLVPDLVKEREELGSSLVFQNHVKWCTHSFRYNWFNRSWFP